MIPENRLAEVAVPDVFINPWSGNRLISLFWGPTNIQQPAEGLLVKIWEARAVGADVYVSAPGVPEFLFYTHTHALTQISLAFNQNGLLHLAFSDTQPLTYLYWYDNLASGMVLTAMDPSVAWPCLTLDDARPFNIPDSDVIFAYIREGVVRYRIQRERFSDEYTPPIGPGGPDLEATSLYHISMQQNLVLGFLTGSAPTFFYRPANIMKKAIVQQKAPAETLDVVFDFTSLMLFDDTIVNAEAVMSVDSGTDPSPESMLTGTLTFTERSTTQPVSGGITGNVYRLAISVLTEAECVYVIEGVIYVNNSLATVPAAP
jgi:hypothetical protein